MGPYGPSPGGGPWRAGKVQKKNTFLLSNTFFLQNHCFWPPDNGFWWKNYVLQVSGRDTLENAIKITSKSKFSTHFVQIPYHLHPARQGAHPALSNSLDVILCEPCAQVQSSNKEPLLRLLVSNKYKAPGISTRVYRSIFTGAAEFVLWMTSLWIKYFLLKLS